MGENDIGAIEVGFTFCGSPPPDHECKEDFLRGEIVVLTTRLERSLDEIARLDTEIRGWVEDRDRWLRRYENLQRESENLRASHSRELAEWMAKYQNLKGVGPW